MSGIIAKNASRSSGIIGPVAGSGSTNNSVDTMTGDASDTTLSLSQTPGSENNVQITFDGVTQHHSTFSLSGSTITFSTAPAIGVLVEAVSGAASTTGTPDDGTVATAKIVNNAVDETKLKDALIGDFSDVTVTAADTFLYGDATDSGNTKKDTVQGILDLAGGGAWNLIGTSVASGGAAVGVTGLDSTYDTYAIVGSDLVPADDGQGWGIQFGDSSGYDSGASDYAWHKMTLSETSTGYSGAVDTADTMIRLVGGVGNASGEGVCFTAFIGRPGDGTTQPMIYGNSMSLNTSTQNTGGIFIGHRQAVITLDRVQTVMANGSNIATGRLSVYGIAHA
jgi:hypothetical protein